MRKRISRFLEDILIEIFVLFRLDFRFSSDPKRFVFIDSFELDSFNTFRDSSVDWIFYLFFVNLFTLFSPFLRFFFDLSFNFCLSFLDFLFSGHKFFEVNWITDKTAVPFNQSLELIILAIFRSILFQVKSNDSSSFNVNRTIRFNCEDIGSWGSPFVLSVLVALWNDFNFGCYKERRVESDTKLTNQVEISFLDIFEVLLGSGVGNGSQITD